MAVGGFERARYADENRLLIPRESADNNPWKSQINT